VDMEWKVLQRRATTYRFFEIVQERVETFKGHTLEMEYAKMPAGVCIMPIHEDERSVICLRQYRHAIRSWQWELPAGGLEAGVDPLTMAKRELMEETGYEAEEWFELGQVYPSFGSTDQVIHLYAAKGLTPGEQQLEEGEELEVAEVPMERFLRMTANGELQHGAALACVARWLAMRR
jgi:ADP-ribose pyrophosphatase